MKKQVRTRSLSRPDAVYVRCSRCGGKFDETLVTQINGKTVCGVCRLIDPELKQ